MKFSVIILSVLFVVCSGCVDYEWFQLDSEYTDIPDNINQIFVHLSKMEQGATNAPTGEVTYDSVETRFEIYNGSSYFPLTQEILATTIEVQNKLGIGTVSPGGALHVYGTDNTTSQILLENTNSGKWGIFPDSSYNGLAFYSHDADKYRMVLTDPGFVGIGIASPTQTLHLHADSSAGHYLKFTNTDTGSTIADGTDIGIDGNEDFIINNRETGKNIEFQIEGTGVFKVDTDYTSILNQYTKVDSLLYAPITSITISSGALSITKNAHIVGPEAGVADDLTSISGGQIGTIITLTHNTPSNTITVKHGTYLRLAGGADFAMGYRDIITLIRIDASTWLEVSRSNNVG